MLADGLSEDGTAHALGWPKARMAAKIRLLEFPGSGNIGLPKGRINGMGD